ncbi:MAG: exopolysaccharide biosynthesis protein [Rhodospirillales bacterium]|nr:exopolysaccharide biosynthesis protein [Rhodospirillales bacterium]
MPALGIRKYIRVSELRGHVKREKNPRVARRMLTISNVLDGISRELPARLAGMDPRALRDRVIRHTNRARTGCAIAGPGPAAGGERGRSSDGFEDIRLAAPSRRQLPDIKRIIDVGLSLGAILACLPLFALIALLVSLDFKGPVVFRQQRIGLNGRPFPIIKFRTMRVLEDGATVVQATDHDTRVTRIGHALRGLSLDELPQLFNVLSGEMSLVGPRPHAVVHDEYYAGHIAQYVGRQRVKPGITGWAQVNGARGATPKLSDMQRRIDFDIWYVDHACLALDLFILAKTPLEVLRRRKAC